MWPFRKKPEPKPWRWFVEERLEQQVVAAVQREHWKRAGPILAAYRQAAGPATPAERNRIAALMAQASVCFPCRGGLHPGWVGHIPHPQLYGHLTTLNYWT